MIIGTWNVNSISVRLPQLIDWIRLNQPDILCLQETKIVDEKFPKASFDEIGYNVAFYGEKTYNGVAIVSKAPLEDVHRGLIREVGPGSKRLISARAGGVHVLNVYIPNGQEVGSEKYLYKMDWLGSLQEHIGAHFDKGERMIMCGDFNIAPEDRDVFDAEKMAGTIMMSEAEREKLALIKEWGFQDVFRNHVNEDKAYSWWDYRMNAFKRNMGWRIDHLWATPELAKTSSKASVDTEARKHERPSDHAPVIAEFNV